MHSAHRDPRGPHGPHSTGASWTHVRTHARAHINTLSFPFRYTENGAHYTGKGFVVGREAIAATWQAAAKGGLANVSFVTVEAIANQDANTIHEYGVATSNQWTDVKYFL